MHGYSEGCLWPCSTLKKPQTHKRLLSWAGGGPQTPTFTPGSKIGAWERPLQGSCRAKIGRGRIMGTKLHKDNNKQANLKRYHQTHRKARIQQQRASHLLCKCSKMLEASCLRTVKIQTKEFSSISWGNADNSLHLQQSPTATSPTSTSTLPKLS